MSEHQGGESFSLEIVALRSEVPVYARLKAVCKRLLRGYAFKLTRISETTPQLPPLPADTAEAQAQPDVDHEGVDQCSPP